MLKNKKIFLTPGNLKYKLRISVCLMSVLPLLVSMYLVSNYILPKMGFQIDVTIALSICISIFISVIGFFVIKEVFDRIVSVSSEAKLIAAGNIDRIIETGREDEISDLGDALNQLTTQIRSNMDELKNYSERTTEINIEIQKRVLVLSSLLQISSLISQGVRLEEVLKLTIEKSRILANSDVSFMLFRNTEEEDFFTRAADGINMQYFFQLKVNRQDPVFTKLIKSNLPLVLDNENFLPEDLEVGFFEKIRLKNILALPIFLRGKVVGILSIGNNREAFVYKKDDMELLDIFAKQIAIAIENDLLLRYVEKLEIKDVLTGLYNEPFIQSRLQEEIRRAIIYQRPCAFIVLNVDNFKKFHQNFGSLQAEAMLKKIGVLVRDSVTEIDRVARTGDNEFAVLLPEKNKRQAQNIAEDVRKRIEFVFSEEKDVNKRITVSGGVSENPLDGTSSEELFSKARELVKIAKSQGKNRIIGFTEKPAWQSEK